MIINTVIADVFVVVDVCGGGGGDNSGGSGGDHLHKGH